MKLLKTKPHLSDKELLDVLNSQTLVRAFKDWQIIYSVQTNYGIKSEDLSRILGVSKTRIYYVIQKYNKYGLNWRKYDNWGGRREERCNLSLEQEQEVLKEVEQLALSGKILTYKDIKDKVELKAGKKVSDDYIWDLFKRHNWKKKMPRTSHPKSNKEKQEEYKKKSKRYWQPNH